MIEQILLISSLNFHHGALFKADIHVTAHILTYYVFAALRCKLHNIIVIYFYDKETDAQL